MCEKTLPTIIQIGEVLLSSDIFTECFCCDLSACKGICCVEGDDGAPVTLEETEQLEEVLPAVWSMLPANAQAEIDLNGVAYADRDGELVTSIVHGKDCVFAFHDENNCCLCSIECAKNAGKTSINKPISCALYPIREKVINQNTVCLNYDRWNVCEPARQKGRAEGVPVYVFLKQPLIKRFGEEWYNELFAVAEQLKKEGLL